VDILAPRLAALDLDHRLRLLREFIPGRIVFTTSFGIEDQLITHSIFTQGLDIDVVTIDTGRLSPQTYELWEKTEARYAQLRGMLGAEPSAPNAAGGVEMTASRVERLYVAPPIMARAPSIAAANETPGPSVPRRWPLSVPAYRTRGLAAGDSSEGHGGVDLAVPVGSEVRASGGGITKETGNDAAYGLYILITHPDGYETMYGHLSRVLVARGDAVNAGQVIGLSGNSGRSTAPHLHFEVRRSGRSVDPFTLVREGT
ncbi:MAG: peptidoglycan DD-metalloendopeptidase family protein, partial [Gemmatimonadales bacterium]|nr:peptidoglycan DD-metalloendopeptidase family protein [Gemmatimonadales bacterium]